MMAPVLPHGGGLESGRVAQRRNGLRRRAVRLISAATGRMPGRSFTAPFGTVVENIDWSDIETFGATVLKFEF